MGARLLAGAQRIAERHDAIREVRGLGLMIGIEFVDASMSRELVQRAFQRGLLLLGAGKTSVRLAPPLIIDDYDVETALGIIGEVVAELG